MTRQICYPYLISDILRKLRNYDSLITYFQRVMIYRKSLIYLLFCALLPDFDFFITLTLFRNGNLGKIEFFTSLVIHLRR